MKRGNPSSGEFPSMFPYYSPDREPARPGALESGSSENGSDPDGKGTHDLVLHAAKPYLDYLHELLSGIPHFVGLINPQGVLVSGINGGIGHEGSGERLFDVGFSWLIRSLGPSGPGQALERGCLKTVRGDGHAAEALHSYATIGVPIRDASARLVGVLTLVIPSEEAHPRTIGLADLAAGAIGYKLPGDYERVAQSLTARAEAAATVLQNYADELTFVDYNAPLILLSRAARTLSGSEGLSGICTALLDEIRDFVPSPSVAIFALNSETGRLDVRASVGEAAAVIRNMCASPKSGVVGKVFSTHETTVSEDLWSDPRVCPEMARRGNLRSLIALPLIHRQDCLGVLAVYSARPGIFAASSDFSRSLLMLMDVFATLATLAMVCTRPVEQLNGVCQKLGLLQETGLALQSASSIDELARDVVRGAMLVLDCRWALFFQMDTSGGATDIHYRHCGTQSLSPENQSMLDQLIDQLPGSTFLSHLVQTRSVFRQDDLSRLHSGLCATPAFGRGMGISLYNRGSDPLGGLLVWRPAEDRPFSELDEHLLTSLAVQAGLALEKNALLVRTLMESEKLKTVFDALSDGVTVMDRDGRAVQVNRAAASHFGINGEGILGQPFSEMLKVFETVEDEWGRHYGDDDNTAAQALKGRENRMKLVVKTRDGKRHCATAHAAPLYQPGRDNDPTGAVLVWHDMTAEMEAQELQRNLLQIATHELRNPITVLEAYLALLSDDRYRSRPGKLDEALSMLRHNVSRIRRMVDSFYGLLRLGTGQMALNRRFVRFADLVNALAPELHALATKKECLLKIDLCEDRGGQWDASLLEQVLLNLVGNSVKFADPGGQIEIASRIEGDFLRVTVSDNGVGIPPQYISEVFKRFFRVPEHITKRNPEGSGLGLAITEAIIKQHAGEIAISSEGENKGTTVYFMLPLDPMQVD